MSVDSIRPIYNLVELDLKEYEENELVLNTIHKLKLFFDQSDNYTYHHTSKQKDIRIYFEKVGFKYFFESIFN